MKIPSQEQYQYWRQIAAHASTPGNHAPWPVQMHLAALVGENDIAGSAARFSPSGPTVWSVVAATGDGRLVKVALEFDAEGFDLEVERNSRDTTPEHRVIEAWARRLDNVVSLEIRKLAHRRSAFKQVIADELDVGDVRLKFVGGEELDLEVDQLDMPYHEERNRTDQLISTIRAHTGL